MDCAVCRGACCETFQAEIYMHPPNRDAQRWLELHATVVDYGTKLAFECRCTKLTPEGRCSIWEDRPLVCELFIAGGKQCLDTVRARRTPEQYQLIRGEDDPLTLDEVRMKQAVLTIHDETGSWKETYKEGKNFGADDDPQQWAEALIAKFNATRRPNETERFLDSVEVGEVPVADETEVEDDDLDESDEADLEEDDDEFDDDETDDEEDPDEEP